MVIGIDARELTTRPAGKGQYLGRLIQSWLPEVASGQFSMVLYIGVGTSLPDAYLGKGVTVCSIKGRGPLWHRAVAGSLKADGVTVFFAALSYISALMNTVPTVTVVHDLAVFRLPQLQHNRRSFLVERLTLRSCCRRSKHIIAVSENTKRDLVGLVRIKENKVSVSHPAALLTSLGKPLPHAKRKPYFLFVGTLEPRKNISGILRAFARLPDAIRQGYSLELAGKSGWGTEDYPLLAAQLGIADRVHFLDYVSDARLLELYQEATTLVYPSLYEGFGLPPLEALSVGTPVISSTVSSLPEVVAEGGILCRPDDIEAISQAMVTLAEDSQLWQQKSDQGVRQAGHFDWGTTAATVLALLKAA